MKIPNSMSREEQEVHEDAFKAANLCAGRMTDLARSLALTSSPDEIGVVLDNTRDLYMSVFNAYIEGVAYGRANPR